MYGSVTLYGHPFQNVPLAIEILRRGPTTPAVHCYITGLGSSPVARHYWGNHCCFLFLRVLRCFSSPGLPLCLAEITVLQTAGLSHSEISGSKVICTSPELIAAYHVLHRLREPRHPPCALTCFSYVILTNNTYIFAYVGIIGRRSYFISVAPGICFENVPDVLLSFSLYCLVCQYVKERWLLLLCAYL